MIIHRFEVYMVNLNPIIGNEIRKMRPCLIISPDEMNHNLRTVLIAPITHTDKAYPTRVACLFHGGDGFVALDQMRAVDKQRLQKKLGSVDDEQMQLNILDCLVRLFSQ